MACGTANQTPGSNAIGYAMHRSRSHRAVIRVCDQAGDVIENAGARGRFQRVVDINSWVHCQAIIIKIVV
ncbi:MAG: hypothetical protein DME56_03775 [Verrucomicrobia bacterium]|nr:MAG: hypothetical protein DME56_03775 [Verrucomicrobiota bacterium]